MNVFKQLLFRLLSSLYLGTTVIIQDNEVYVNEQ
jgi:hypothetical protein